LPALGVPPKWLFHSGETQSLSRPQTIMPRDLKITKQNITHLQCLQQLSLKSNQTQYHLDQHWTLIEELMEGKGDSDNNLNGDIDVTKAIFAFLASAFHSALLNGTATPKTLQEAYTGTTADHGGFKFIAYVLSILWYIYSSLINMRCLHILLHI
jgi:hypothetical protein